MTEKTIEQLAALSLHLGENRESVLKAWRDAAGADPEQTTADFLTRAQFNDHIPPLLDAFEQKLRARPGGVRAAVADQSKTTEDIKHGLQRWQQGYRLAELMHEWGHLHVALAGEIHRFVAMQPEIARDTLAAAHDELISMISEGINRSVGEYTRLQQTEAAGHVRDLKQALAKVSQIEQHRAELIRQAVHDLRGNVQSVNLAANVLGETEVAETDRIEFAQLIKQELDSVNSMLGNLMELARLEAGQEKRETQDFDGARALEELCAALRPVATARKLFLVTEGAPALAVQGDPGKLRRLVQNLLVNALKYTVRGGVTVSWGEEKESWWVRVQDTGPGMLGGPSAPIVAEMKEATASARETDQKAAAASGEAPSVLPLPADDSTVQPPQAQNAGEGIGLSIVKRLCELLDASLEMASSAETGTTFRVVLPRRYRGFVNTPPS